MMDFSEALRKVKNRERVAREGWNGKGMWIELAPMNLISDVYLPYIAMKTADDKFVPWLASQTDLLAEDWTVIDG